MAINRVSPKKGKVVDIPDATITIGTPTAGTNQVSVAFTVASTPATGGPVQKYTAISSPGSVAVDSSTSPIVITGLTAGTSYTFQVAAANATGRGPLSSASASAVPLDPAKFSSIATVAVGAGGASSISFTSIPSTYKHLQVRLIARNNDTSIYGSGLKATFNSDTGANYAYHILRGDGGGGTPGTYNGTGQTSTLLSYDSAANGEMANMFGAGVIDIIDYQNTNKYKTVRSLIGRDNNGSGGGGGISHDSGLWMSTSAISTINILPNGGTGFMQYSHFALYGIEG
jgi:hypothetical protein